MPRHMANLQGNKVARGYDKFTTSDDYITPKRIIKALGPFDLDPCACKVQPWRTAHRMWTDNGLDRPWAENFVFLNPPYGQKMYTWLERLSDHGPGGIALIHARTCTAGFHKFVFERAHALLFLKGRVFFHLPTGEKTKSSSGAPTVAIGYGQRACRQLYQALTGRTAGGFRTHRPLLNGKLVKLKT